MKSSWKSEWQSPVDAIAAEVERYCAGVLDGSIVSGKLVRLAVERHKRDLADGAARGLFFLPKAGAVVIQWFGLLHHSKGKRFAGLSFELADWQKFILWVLFGWYRKDGEGRDVRRFRVGYVQIARKNGKSTLAAGIALYLLAGDGEPSAEVYCAATKRYQARITWEEAKRMVKASPFLRTKIQAFKTALVIEKSESKCEPLGADSDTMDGLGPSGYIVDEYHAHKTADVFNVLDSGTGGRDAPLGFVITTAGDDEQGPCGMMRDYGRKILERAIDDDTRFYYIAEPDEGDDPWELETWQKANPNLGISIRLEDFRSTADTARQMPTSRNEFLRKRLNIWTKVRTLAINMEDWNTCSDHVDEAALAGRDCYGGLDLSMRGDLTAFALLFPPLAPDEKWQLLCRCWIPENTVAAKEKTDRVLYSHWIQQGLLIATEGDRQNYAEVRRQIVADCAAFNVLMIAFDRWNAEETRQLLEAEGVQMREFDQTIRGYNEPTQRFLRMVQNHELAHGGNSLLKWCASNLEVKTDHNQNVRPVKPDYRQTARIDPIVATIMAVGEAIRSAQTANYLSIL